MVVFLFLGFPSSWEKVLAILTGILVIFMAYKIKFKENSAANGSSFTDNLSTNTKQSGQDNNQVEAPSLNPDAKE